MTAFDYERRYCWYRSLAEHRSNSINSLIRRVEATEDERDAAEADAAYWQDRALDAEARIAAIETALDR